jgi:hypothetical protein
MKFLRIESSKFTPGIILDPNHMVLEFYGFSLPENAIEFYQPVINWLLELKDELSAESGIDKNNIKEINIIFKLVYYNSASLRQILDIFQIFGEMHHQGFPLHLVWQYDSEDPQMADAGKELGEITNMPVSIVAYN